MVPTYRMWNFRIYRGWSVAITVVYLPYVESHIIIKYANLLILLNNCISVPYFIAYRALRRKVYLLVYYLFICIFWYILVI